MLTLVAAKRGDRGFSFDDLIASAAYYGATVGELAGWMADSLADGLIVAVDCEPGERIHGRLYRIVSASASAAGLTGLHD